MKALTLAVSAFLSTTFLISGTTFAQAPTPVQLFAFSCQGQGFVKNCRSGANPGTVIQASDGNFYGVTFASTVGNSSSQGGSVFKLRPSGTFTLLHTFAPGTSKNFAGGSQPGPLVEGKDGNLYGTTLVGGGHNVGVLFRIGKDGAGFKVLHSFCSAANCADGSFASGVTAGSDGNIYGATIQGGAQRPNCSFSTGCGTVFRFKPSNGSYKVLHAFAGDDGTSPTGLIQASDGNFYGAAVGGNTNGNIFQITPAGEFKIVITIPQLVLPITPLTQGANGNLFGLAGAANGNIPGLFEVGLDGSNFQQFAAPTLSNALSLLPVLAASDGNFWASTTNGGENNDGMIVQLSGVDGSVLQTISFDGTNGQYPDSALIQAADGKLLGTTFDGGVVTSGTPAGVVFTLNANLPPPRR